MATAVESSLWLPSHVSLKIPCLGVSPTSPLRTGVQAICPGISTNSTSLGGLLEAVPAFSLHWELLKSLHCQPRIACVDAMPRKQLHFKSFYAVKLNNPEPVTQIGTERHLLYLIQFSGYFSTKYLELITLTTRCYEDLNVVHKAVQISKCPIHSPFQTVHIFKLSHNNRFLIHCWGAIKSDALTYVHIILW